MMHEEAGTRMSSDAISFFPEARVSASSLRSPADARSKRESGASINTIGAALKERSDEDLLLQVGSGSKEALSILFQRHAGPVFSVAQRILRDTSEAEDLLQELFLFLFQKARLFDPAKASAASWIIQMTYHRAIDRRRYLIYRQHYNAQELKEEQLHATKGQISIDDVTARTLMNKLRKELSPEQRQILELHFLEGYSFHEIAEKTGQTFGNIRHHYYRGLERLRSYVFPEKHG
jgi:RNA polymerase sigma-70 factor, ECF subfamily